MDINTILSTLVGGIFTLIGAFGAIYWTNRLDRKKAAQTKYIEKIEEIGAYMPQLQRWYKEESYMYWDVVEEDYIYDTQPNKYDCPFYEIENLVNWWLPSLREQAQAIGEVVSCLDNLRGYDGARAYSSGGDMRMLASDLQLYDKRFKKNYDHIWHKIGAEAKKAVS